MKAETWLRDRAQKEGWAKASKLQSRPMSQGLIGIAALDKAAAIVEVSLLFLFFSEHSFHHRLCSCFYKSSDVKLSRLMYFFRCIFIVSTFLLDRTSVMSDHDTTL